MRSFWVDDFGELSHKSPQVSHIGFVGSLMLGPELQEFVKWYRVHVEANGLEVESDYAFTGRHSLS